MRPRCPPGRTVLLAIRPHSFRRTDRSRRYPQGKRYSGWRRLTEYLLSGMAGRQSLPVNVRATFRIELSPSTCQVETIQKRRKMGNGALAIDRVSDYSPQVGLTKLRERMIGDLKLLGECQLSLYCESITWFLRTAPTQRSKWRAVVKSSPRGRSCNRSSQDEPPWADCRGTLRGRENRNPP